MIHLHHVCETALHKSDYVCGEYCQLHILQFGKKIRSSPKSKSNLWYQFYSSSLFMKTDSTFAVAFFNEVFFVCLFVFLIQIFSFCQRLKEKTVYTIWVRWKDNGAWCLQRWVPTQLWCLRTMWSWEGHTSSQSLFSHLQNGNTNNSLGSWGIKESSFHAGT